MSRSNDRTEATLPAAETDHRNRPGPKLPVVIGEANVGLGETEMFAARQPASRFQFSSRLFSGMTTAKAIGTINALRVRLVGGHPGKQNYRYPKNRPSGASMPLRKRAAVKDDR